MQNPLAGIDFVQSIDTCIVQVSLAIKSQKWARWGTVGSNGLNGGLEAETGQAPKIVRVDGFKFAFNIAVAGVDQENASQTGFASGEGPTCARSTVHVAKKRAGPAELPVS